MQEKDFSKIETKNNIWINVYCYKNKLTFPIYISGQEFGNSMDLLLATDETSPIMCTSKILTNLCFTKQKMKTKNTFAKVVHSALVAKMYWQSIKKLVRALMVHNRVKGTIKFKNYFKQIAVPFKIYADFEWDLERGESYEGSYSKRYQDDIPCSFSYKLGCVDDKLTKPIVVFRGENPAYEFIKAIFKEYLHCKKVINKHFYKNLIMSEEEE